MQKIGYSLIDSSNTEIKFWGDTLGQDFGIPNPIIIPDVLIAYAPVVGEIINGEYKLVERWIVANSELSDLYSGQTTEFDGEKIVVTHQYRNPTQQELLARSASKRYDKETSGVMIGNNHIYTDRQSQAMITGISTLLQLSPNTVINFKTSDGFIEANSSNMSEIALGVASHIQTCFSTESLVANEISANNITTFDQVDQAYI